ncbi:acyl-CoA dehydrogenase family protein [Streptomyces hyderabadensis]|uniref:Acyl-CoA dehydrogenase family protein n=2 Tax=Streptomyces hyderabadensis TaxID=598549 RepID=A0ABP9IHY9_9ACTN|nr:acyl-CoA dehydrogenase family protein [Streptomyces hyderabadensis]
MRDAAGRLPRPEPGQAAGRDVWQAAGECGITGLCLPEEHGGGGLGALDTALGLEAFCAGGADTGLAFAIAAHLLACGTALAEHADEPVRADLLRGLGSGRTIAANAMTEDGAGSDVSRLATTAVRDGDAYVLDGVKSFVSNGPLADILVTYAVTAPAAGFLGLSAFAVPTDLPGVRIGPPLAKAGLDGCAAARVEFSGCRVPGGYLMGAEGQGSAIFQTSMTWERACLPAIYLGTMEAQLRRCVTHARQRRQFGRRIADFQAVSHRLATMKQRLESSRLLLYRACWQVDQGSQDAGQAAALAKVAVAESAVANGVDAAQVFGARGYLTAEGVDGRLSDLVPLHIFSGTTDIQREIIVRGMGL